MLRYNQTLRPQKTESIVRLNNGAGMATLPEHQTIVALVKTGVNVASVLLCFFCIISLYLYILHALSDTSLNK